MMRCVRCRLLVWVVITAVAFPLAVAQAHNGSWAIDVVRPGDTLSAIAKRHGTTWKRLAHLNGVSRLNVFTDKALIVPRSSLTVGCGGTLWELAMRHGMDVSALRHANDPRTGQHLVRGKRIPMPQAARAP